MGVPPFSQLLVNTVSAGCVLGLYLHRNTKCSWEKNLLDEKFTIFTYFFGVYFTFHVATWFVIFSYLYQTFIEVGLNYLVLIRVRSRFQNAVSFLFQIAFGYWTAGEILGGWCDLEHFRECIQNAEEEQCDSFLIKRIARWVQSICEYFTYDYDAEIDVLYRRADNFCVPIFGFAGHFIMTLIGFLFSLLIYSFSGPKRSCMVF